MNELPNFETVVLTDDEYGMLKVLSMGPILVTNKKDALIRRLHHFGFAVIGLHVSSDLTELRGLAAAVTDRGLDYLAWASQKREEERSGFRRDVLLLLLGALIAFLFDHLGKIVAFLESLRQLWQK